ncbi:AAA family ATPase [Acinetobacter sp. AOR15_HL]|uniref:AAA family ATPase n=1 Tax=unclassified Acinetobacter TaxID=196816 RepID=UPI0022EAE0CF|nr:MULTISPECIES: AAA family ATPase [unclassified Acinetobacter]MDA3556354.1 AAA family ATPase [Acinetobacter sp. AOR15_HL]MDA3571811.1 AAA family ATPase [Acinetobacter sp. AOR14_HL]
MKIDKLHIYSKFKQLEDFEINFDEDSLMTVIVGKNGSGKSNVLEALVSIFRNLDLGESPPFSYKLVYRLGRDPKLDSSSKKWLEVEVEADVEKKTLNSQYTIHCNNLLSSQFSSDLNSSKKIPITKVKRDKFGNSDYLPKYLFAYYSGPSDRLEKYFIKHRTNFYRKLLQDELNLKGDIRPLFYAKPYHSQFVLLAFFLSDQQSIERKFILEHLEIEDLDSVHFVLRQPNWAKDKDELFWGAKGIVRKFLDELIKHALAPLKIKRQENTSLTGKNIRNEFFHLFLPDLNSLKNFAKDLTPDELFKMLESLLLSEIISEVSVRVKVKSNNFPLTFNELSEGEQQLLTVLGLLKFTGGEDSLFLLDEPDTHLNPAWAVKYLKFLKQFVPNEETSHLLMVTHHPLAIAELEKKQVQVMTRDENYNISAIEPDESPRGMGINLILRSDMFGLKSTLDEFTNRKLKLRNSLAAKEILSSAQKIFDEEIGFETEEQCLARLNEELESLGFNLASDDPDYMDFLQEKYQEGKEP